MTFFGYTIGDWAEFISIIGMSLQPIGTTSSNAEVSTQGNPNLISYSTLSAYNSKIDSLNFKNTGEVDITDVSVQ